MTPKTYVRRALTSGTVRLAALILTVLLLCTALPSRSAQAAEWMQPYLDQVVEWGVMGGDATGNLHEDRPITRAELVTLINRAFGYTEPGPHPFTDVTPRDWFAEDIGIAYNVGYFGGTSANTASPRALVTREQAAVLLGRCLRLQGTTGAASSTFTDAYQIGGWSRGLVQEAADLGIIGGYADGTFRPRQNITRGQMACFLVRALGTLIQEPGELSSGGVYGNLTINVPGVKLKDTTITGNLYLTGGVGLGNVELENVNVLGKIVVCGGGEAEGGKHSIILRNVTAGTLEVDSLTEQFLSVHAEGLTDIANTIVRTSAYVEDLTDDDMGLKSIQLDGLEGSQFQLAGNIKHVINLTPDSALQIAQGVAGVVTIDEKAVNATLTIDKKTTVQELNLDRGTQVTGEGSIGHLNINAPGSNVSMLPDTITVRPGITGNIYNQDMDTGAAAESSEDPRLLAGYPAAKNVAPTSADAVFRTNKTGTIHWGLTALMDGSLGEDELMNPSAYSAKIIRSGTANATASNTDITARLTGLTREGSYYISALLEDARGRRSPVKVAAFTTPDDTAPNFATGYPQAPIITTDADNEQIAQIMVMPTKDCQMYYVLLPTGSAAPTAADFRSAALPGNLGFGIVSLRKNTPFLVSRINSSHLQEQTTYDLYLWLNDADNGKSSAVRRVQITTKDMTPPNIQHLTVTDIQARSVRLTFSLDEPGTLYFAVVKHGTQFYQSGITGPNDLQAKIQIENGVGSLRRYNGVRVARAGVDGTINVTGLEPQTAYDLYFVAKDTAGNYNIYNEGLMPPMKINTADDNPPTVKQEFENDASQEGQPNPTPYPNTTVRIVFSESVLGYQDIGGQRSYIDDFMDAYQKVRTASTADKPARERELADMLRNHIRLYNNRTKLPVADRTAENADTVGDNWVLDYRKATVYMDATTGEMIISFPYLSDLSASAVNLASGDTYYFIVSNIADTSIAKNIMETNTREGYRLPNFTTTFATVNLQTADTVDINRNALASPSDFPTDNNVDGDNFRVNWSFTLTPDATNQVADNVGWDMLIWTDTKLEFSLYSRSRPKNSTGSSGWGAWRKLGVSATAPIDKSDDSSLVYISLTRSTFLNNSTEFPRLNTLDQDTEYEYAIHLTSVKDNDNPNGWISEINMRATIMAGGTTAMNQSSLVYQGNEGTLANGIKAGALSIGEPDPFTYTIAPEEREGPKLNEGYPLISYGDTAANVTVALDRVGTAYFMAVPLTPTSGTEVTGSNYSAPITIALKDNTTSVELPDIAQVPANGRDLTGKYENPLLRLPAASTVATRTEEGGIRWASREYPQAGLAGEVSLTGLKPDTTYLLLIATRGVTRYSQYVYCYTFTTSEVVAPKLELRADGNTAQARTDLDAEVRGLLILDGSNRDLLRPFSTAEGTAKTDDYKDSSGLTADGKYSVLDALINSHGTGNGIRNSVFDQYATENLKNDIFSLIESSSITPNSVIDVVERFNVPMGTTWTNVRPFRDMEGGRWYCFLAYAESPLGSDRSFRAVRPLQISDTQWPTVNPTTGVTATFAPRKDGSGFDGRVTITFSEDLYFQTTDSGVQDLKPVTPTPLDIGSISGNWVSRQTISGDLPIGWKVYTEEGTPRNTRQMSFETTNGVAAGDYTFSIRAGLCDQWGNQPSGGNSGFQVTVRIAGNDTDGYTYSVSGVPTEWTGP